MPNTDEAKPVRRRGRLTWVVLAMTVILLAAWGVSEVIEIGCTWYSGNSSFYLSLSTGGFDLTSSEYSPEDAEVFIRHGRADVNIRKIDPFMRSLFRFGFRTPLFREFTNAELTRVYNSSKGVPQRSTLLFVPLWIPLLLLVPLTVVTLRRVRPQPLPGHCEECGYDLQGNTSGICPECGMRTGENSTGNTQ